MVIHVEVIVADVSVVFACVYLCQSKRLSFTKGLCHAICCI